MTPDKGQQLAALLRELVSIMGGEQITAGVAKAISTGMRNRPPPYAPTTDSREETEKDRQR